MLNPMPPATLSDLRADLVQRGFVRVESHGDLRAGVRVLAHHGFEGDAASGSGQVLSVHANNELVEVLVAQDDGTFSAFTSGQLHLAVTAA